MNNKKLNQNETGRSMVEMLGVLAVMGLLTIIGIAGFRVALNKHYANQTVERLMRRAVVVAGQANFGQNLSLHEFDENDGEYPIPTESLTHDAESFTLTVDNVPQEVCQQIIGMDWKLAKIIPEDCSDTTMKFKFLNDLTDCSTCVADSVDCPPESEMQCGKCSVVKGFADNNDDCEGNENGQYCVRGKCSKCEEGWFLDDFNHVSCRQCGVDQSCVSLDQATRCLGTGYRQAGEGCWYMAKCDSTDEPTRGSESTSCKACPNRCYHVSSGRCRLYGPDKDYLKNADGTCYCNPREDTYAYNGYCLYRPEGTYVQTHGTPATESCTTGLGGCTNAEQSYRCPGQGFYAWSAGCNHMHACADSTEAISVAGGGYGPESCRDCPNRCYDNWKCYLYGEGYTYLYKDRYGNCTNTVPSE